MENNVEKVIINFERSNGTGDFDNARCELPSYTWLYNEGYSKEELSFMRKMASKYVEFALKYNNLRSKNERTGSRIWSFGTKRVRIFSRPQYATFVRI